jgi:hypothetical protein
MDFWDFNAAQAGIFRGGQIIIFTINGAGVTLYDGYGADMARALCNTFPYFLFQPVGYDSKPFPMKPGLDGGTAEVVRLLLEVYPTGPFVIIPYSEGAIVAADVLDILRDPTSPIAHRYQDCLAVAAYGNPRREAGSVAPGCIDPGGFGIVEPNLVDTPSWWHDFANGPSVPGAGGWDLYTTCSNAKPGSVELKDMRDVWSTVYTGTAGKMAKLIFSSIFLPWKWVGAFKAIVAAGSFFGSGTLPHTDYSVSYPIPNDPRDAWRIGFDYLAQVGAAAVTGNAPSTPVQPDAPLFPPVRA